MTRHHPEQENQKPHREAETIDVEEGGPVLVTS